MKHLLIIAFWGVVTLGFAQDTPPAPGTSPMQENLPREPEQEMNALSGTLKELRGKVHKQLGILDAQLENATAKTTDRLAEQRKELKEASAEIEAMLNEVNTPGKEDWEMIKSKAEEVIENVTEKLARAKDTSTSAVN